MLVREIQSIIEIRDCLHYPQLEAFIQKYSPKKLNSMTDNFCIKIIQSLLVAINVIVGERFHG